MTPLTYPVYVEGQTLTAEELNDELGYVVGRDQRLGRALGFGVSCGLGGTVTGSTLQVSPGIAVDHDGEVLVLDAPVAIPVPPTPSTEAFEFVTGTDGFSVVLAAADTAAPAEPCSEAGCDGHAELHTAGVRLVVVRGSLAPGSDFAAHPFVTANNPLTANEKGEVVGDFDALRTAIRTELGTQISTTARDKLDSIALDAADPSAIRLYKAGFLNQLLFATLDLLRFQALMKVSCLRQTTTPGVVLGWLRQTGGTWTWECARRHHWEPPTGLVMSLLGGGCESPERPWLQRIESLILTFSVPVVPPPGEGPKPFDPGEFEVCKGPKCWHWVAPPKKIPPHDWKEFWYPPDDAIFIDPLWDPPKDYEVLLVDQLDPTDAGVIDLVNVIGTSTGQAQPGLEILLRAETELEPRITVMTLDQAAGTPGLEYSTAVSPADTIVLIGGEDDKVVATGRIAVGQSLREVGTSLPVAKERAKQALDIAEGFEGQIDGIGQTLELMDVQFQEFSDFQAETSQWRSGIDGSLSDVPQLIETEVLSEVGRFRLELSTQLSTLVGEAMRGVQEKLDTTSETVIGLQQQVQVNAQAVERATGRIDVLFTKGVTGGVLPERDVRVGTEVVEVLKVLRETVAATAPEDQAELVRTRLAAADDGIARLEAVRAAGGSGVTESPETLTAIVTSLVDGLQALGAPANDIRSLRSRTTALRKVLET